MRFLRTRRYAPDYICFRLKINENKTNQKSSDVLIFNTLDSVIQQENYHSLFGLISI